MRQRLLYIAWTAAVTLFMPALAWAADDEGVIPNAKAMGYNKIKVAVADRSMTVVWLLFFLLAAICIAAVFKNAKRSHLD